MQAESGRDFACIFHVCDEFVINNNKSVVKCLTTLNLPLEYSRSIMNTSDKKCLQTEVRYKKSRQYFKSEKSMGGIQL